MISALKTLSELLSVFRRPSREEWLEAQKQVAGRMTAERWAMCKMLVSRGLAPGKEWRDLFKLPDDEWDKLMEYHSQRLKDDPEYKKEYLAVVEAELREAEEFDAQLREHRKHRTG